MSFQNIQKEDRRATILNSLQQDTDYTQNDQILKSVLASVGHKASDATLQSDLSWLSDAELITVEWVGDICIASLTRHGEDVATGATTIKGVKRPRPAQ